MDAAARLQPALQQFVERIQKLADEVLGKPVGQRPGLRPAEQRIREAAQALGHAATALVAGAYGDGYVGARRTCTCGGTQRFKRTMRKQMLDLQGGTIEVSRSYYYCDDCGQGFLPLDEELELPREALTPTLADVVELCGAVAPFEAAASLLQRTLGVQVSGERVRRRTERTGQRCREADQRQAERSVAEAGAGGQPPTADKRVGVAEAQRQYLMLDGGMVPTREGFREAKIGICFRAADQVQLTDHRAMLLHKQFFGDLVAAEPFGPLVYAAARRAGVRVDGSGCEVLGDGAKWIWNLKAEQLPQATETVDWYHAKEHLFTAAYALYGEGTPRARQWAEQRADQLWREQHGAVLQALARTRPTQPAACAAVRELRSYLTENRPRMHYASRRKRGLLVGSGAVEGGIKYFVQDRLKRAGMRWSVLGARQVLALRARWVNGDWDQPGARPAARVPARAA